MARKSKFDNITRAYEYTGSLEALQEQLRSITLNASHRQAWSECIEELRSSQPPTYTIGVVGGTGGGKSTLLSALLGREVLPTSSSVSPCQLLRHYHIHSLQNKRATTAAITKILYNPEDRFAAKIEFITEAQWLEEIELTKQDLDGILDRNTSKDTEVLSARLRAVYPALASDLSHIRNSNAQELLDELKGLLQIPKMVCCDKEDDFLKELAPFVSTPENIRERQLWPLVSMVEIYVHVEMLSHGLCFVDLPGIGDNNVARNQIAQQYIENVDEIWIVSRIDRIVDNKDAYDLLNMTSGLLYADGRTGLNRVVFIATMADIPPHRPEHLNPSQCERYDKLNQDLIVCDARLNQLRATKTGLLTLLNAPPRQIIPSKRDASNILFDETFQITRPSDSGQLHPASESCRDIWNATVTSVQQLRINVKKLEDEIRILECDKYAITKSSDAISSLARNAFVTDSIRMIFEEKMASNKNNIPDGAQLPVFCVASSDYLRLSLNSIRLPMVFGTPEETGILAIRKHVEDQLLAFQIPSAKFFLTKAKNVLEEVGMYLLSREAGLGTHLHLRKCADDELGMLKKSLDQIVLKHEAQITFEVDQFLEDLRNNLDEAKTTAENEWSQLAKSITHHCTYKATMRRNGEFRIFNFNEALVNAAVQSGNVYESFFKGKLPSIIRLIQSNMKKTIKMSVKKMISVSGPQLSDNLRHSGVAIISRALSQDMEAKSIKVINDSRRKLVHSFPKTMKTLLEKHYQEVSLESGQGMVARMKKANLEYIKDKKGYLFDQIADNAKGQVEYLKRKIFETVRTSGNAQMISRVKRAFSALYEDVVDCPSVELQSRDAIKLYVSETIASIDRVAALLSGDLNEDVNGIDFSDGAHGLKL